ncbi:MAG: hypothetical protein ACFFBP_24395 [Promethearchaeota archaeon]
MIIDPKVTKLSIFNGGGGIVEREIKLTLNQGINEFEIDNIPASFDPNSADIKLEYVSPADKDLITLQQTIVSLPDVNTSQQIIDREKSAATNVISYSIDFTRELREKVSNICEASSYRTYADMKGTFNFIINSKVNSEVVVKILYFIADLRIKWETTLQVNINEDGKSAEIEAYLIVDNQTGFSYEDVDLGFAIFELPRTRITTTEAEFVPAANIPMEQQAFAELSKAKRTQRMRNIML